MEDGFDLVLVERADQRTDVEEVEIQLVAAFFETLSPKARLGGRLSPRDRNPRTPLQQALSEP